jgi:hypothetical protein
MPLRVAPYRTIATEVAERLAASRTGDPLSPWNEDVIVPSRGLADSIGRALLERLPHGFAGLRIRTLDELAADLAARAGRLRRVASDAERRLAMRTAIRSIDHPMMESRGVAAMLERSYRDVRDSGLTLAETASRSGRTRGLRNRDRTQLLIRVWSEYERLIARLECIDPADVFREAVEAASQDAAPQLLAGFYDMTGSQLALVRRLLQLERISAIWVPTDAPFARPLIEALNGSTAPSRGDGSGASTISIRTFDTRFDELAGVCARIAALLENGAAASDVGIVARSLEPYDRSLLRRFSSEHGFRITLQEELPLASHRLGRGAITLCRLRERGFPRADVLELVRDGLRTKTSLAVDAVDAATRRARIAGGTSAELSRMRTRTAHVDTYIALVRELEDLTSSMDGAWLEQLSSLFRIESETDLLAAEKLDEIAAVFRRASAWNRGFDVASAIDAIDNETLTVREERDSGSPTVWAGEILRFRGRSFRHLFVVRMQDDVFPQRRIEDPLLPDSDRRLLGIREIGDGREEEQLLFALTQDAGAECSYSLAHGDGMAKVLRPSRYLRQLQTATEVRAQTDSRPVVSRSTDSNVRVRPLQLIARAGSQSVFDGHIGPFAAQQLQALSPTQLEDFGECPQKFLLKHILGVSDFEDPEREIQIHHREKGTIDHRILERFYRATSGPELARAASSLPNVPSELQARLEAIIDEQFDELERDAPAFNGTVRGIERRATKRLLQEFLVSDLGDLEEQQVEPRWFEYRFGAKHRELADHPEPFVVDAAGVPVRVEGTIDRIDHGRGRFRIVDYKSGKALRHVNLADKIDRGVRLQLALYAMAVSEFFGAEPSTVSATIKPLVIGEKLEKFGFALQDKREILLETLGIFIRAIQRGDFPAFPNENDAEFNSCKYCPVNQSCRTKHDPDERYAIAQLRDPRTLLGGRP